MTFEEAVKELNKLFEFPDVPEHIANDYDYEFAGSRFDLIEILEKLQETYAPKIKMTKQEFERFNARFATSGMSGFKIELDKNGEEHSLYTKTELIAWIHPELIEVE